MDEQTFRGLRNGDQIEVEYQGSRYIVTVESSIHGDRWGEQIVVRFERGAVWGCRQDAVIRKVA